jgi:hypothetical protein
VAAGIARRLVMKRYTVNVQATATTQVVVEARDEEEAKRLAERTARKLKSRFLWGYQGVVAAKVLPYSWSREEEWCKSLEFKALQQAESPPTEESP